MSEPVEFGSLGSVKIDPDNYNIEPGSEENESSGRKRKLPPWMDISTKENTNGNKQDDSDENSKRSKSDEHEAHQDDSDSGTTLSIKKEPDTPDSNDTIKQEESDQNNDTNNPVVKVEPVDNDEPSASTNPVNNNGDEPPVAVKVEVVDNASSAERPSCRFGIKCYRANLIHRREEAHPGDSDYRRPEYPKPAEGTPDCPFGSTCYRRNPLHFRDYAHPPDTHVYCPPPANGQVNNRNNQIQLQQRSRQRNNPNNNRQNDPFDSDSELDLPQDPFFDDDEGSDYMPSDVEDEGVETDLEAEE